MNEKELKKVKDDAHFGGASMALDWVINIMDGNQERLNLKDLDGKCDEIRGKLEELKNEITYARDAYEDLLNRDDNK